MGKPDRDFMIATRQEFAFAAIQAETGLDINLHTVIPPIDVYINAIHRIAVLRTVPNDEFFIQTSLQSSYKEGNITFDGEALIRDFVALLVAEGMLHYSHPNNYDTMIYFYDEKSEVTEILMTSEFFRNFLFNSTEVGRISTYPDKGASTITVGHFDLLTIIECRVA